MQGRPPRDIGELMWVRRVCGLLNRIREAIVGNFSSNGVAHLFVAAKMFSALPGVHRHLFATEVFHCVRLAVIFFTVPPTVFHATPGLESCRPGFGAGGGSGTDPSREEAAAHLDESVFPALVMPGLL